MLQSIRLTRLEEQLKQASLSEDKEAALCKVVTTFTQLPTREEMAILKAFGFTVDEVDALINAKLPYMIVH